MSEFHLIEKLLSAELAEEPIRKGFGRGLAKSWRT